MNINIKGIKIENFRSIKEVEIDFFNNTNGIQEDLKLGRFKLTDDGKHAIANHYAIMGRNSIGKTTVLEAISWVGDNFSGEINAMLMQRVLKNHMKTNMDSIHFNNSLDEQPEELQDEILQSMKNGSGKYYEELQDEEHNFFLRFFQENAHDRSKSIKVTILLFVGGKSIDISVSLLKNGLKTTNTSKGRLPKEEFEPIYKYLSSIAISSNSYPYGEKSVRTFDVSKMRDKQNTMNDVFISIIHRFGLKKTIQILKLADVKVKDITVRKFQNGREVVKSIILENGSEVDIMNLSTGTRQFMAMIYQITPKHPRGSDENEKLHEIWNGLVLIDEIDGSLHTELVDSLKVAMQILFETNNYQFIFTTHNPMSLVNYTSKKQVISLSDSLSDNGVIKAVKMSSILKPNQSILKAYKNGALSPYPDVELSRNTMVDIYYD